LAIILINICTLEERLFELAAALLLNEAVINPKKEQRHSSGLYLAITFTPSQFKSSKRLKAR
jgi:hypothetical protein